MIGLWLLCWAAWGGSIKTENNVPSIETGLGLNPPTL